MVAFLIAITIPALHAGDNCRFVHHRVITRERYGVTTVQAWWGPEKVCKVNSKRRGTPLVFLQAGQIRTLAEMAKNDTDARSYDVVRYDSGAIKVTDIRTGQTVILDFYGTPE